MATMPGAYGPFFKSGWGGGSRDSSSPGSFVPVRFGAPQLTQEEKNLGISVGADGRYYIGGNDVNPSEIMRNKREQESLQSLRSASEQAEKSADPFAGQRGQYQQKLSSLLQDFDPSSSFNPANPALDRSRIESAQSRLDTLLSDPGSMTTSPLYRALLDQGTEAVNRSAAAKGLLGSGNRLLELQKVGQSAATQTFFPMAQLLGGQLEQERAAQARERELGMRSGESRTSQTLQLADLLGRFSGANVDPSSATRAKLGVLELGERERQFNLGPNRQRSFLGSTETTRPTYSVF